MNYPSIRLTFYLIAFIYLSLVVELYYESDIIIKVNVKNINKKVIFTYYTFLPVIDALIYVGYNV